MAPVDINYQKLNVKITPLEKDDRAYQVILKYVQNTHAPTHNGYTLHVDNVFVVESKEEEKVYRKEL